MCYAKYKMLEPKGYIICNSTCMAFWKSQNYSIELLNPEDWVNSGSWWWTGRPGVLRFMGSQRVGHDWATELNWTEGRWILPKGTLWGCPWIYAFVKTNRIVHLAELFQIPKDGAVKVLYSICQQIWKTQRWPQDWKRSVSFQSQRKAIPKNVQTIAQLHSSHI